MTPNNERRTALKLATAQALFQTSTIIMVTVGGLIGWKLAPDARLATLPLASVMVAGTLAMIPAALFMQRFGRRAGFLLGACLGVAAGAMALLAISMQSFWVFLAANGLLGTYSAFAGYYRFAAADMASAGFRSQALSWVVAGGVAAALLGPAIVRNTDGLGWGLYVAPFVAMMVLGALAIVLVSRLQLPAMTSASNAVDDTPAEPARPLSQIFRQPVFIAAITGTTVGFAVMVMVMTATPLAMQICGLSLASSAMVIQWHMLGMFVPSFFTGKLIKRFGTLPIMSIGVILLATHIGVVLSGIEFFNFVTGLILLGVGWNFLFVGGSLLLTEACRPVERARAQAAHDFVMYGVTSIASLSAGGLLATLGWRAVNLAAIPALLLVGCAIANLAWRRRVAARIITNPI